MRRMLKRNRGGKIPFAYVAVILLLMVTVLSVANMGVDELHASSSVEEGGVEVSRFTSEVARDLEERAYYFTMEIIRNVTRDTNPDLREVQNRLGQKIDDYIGDRYPRNFGQYRISVKDHDIKLVTRIMDLDDMILAPETRNSPEDTYYNLDIEEPNTKSRFLNQTTRASLYPRIVGHIRYRISDMRRGITIEEKRCLDKNLYVPVPLIKKGVDSIRFSFRDDRGYANLMVKYMLTTVAEHRVLMGVGGGGYDDNLEEREGLDDIIIPQDVELAVNIALLLEMARNFRDYDINIAKAIDQHGYTGVYASRTMEQLIKDYVRNGTVDAADILMLFYGYDDTIQNKIDLGKVMAQAIYAYADRFSYELYDFIWGHDSADQYHLVDPTLKEPIENWNEVKGKGENWAKQMVYIWLDKFRGWLGVPTEISQREDSAHIDEMSVYYAMGHTPPPSTAGTYYVFGGLGTPGGAWNGGTWHIRTLPVDDTIDLVMGQVNNNVQGRRMMPSPYEITCWDSFGSTVGQKTYQYYLVDQSLIWRHSDNEGSAYMDTFEYIVESLDKSISNRRGDNFGNQQEAGFLDTVAISAKDMGANIGTELNIDPRDKATVIYDGVKDLLYDNDGNKDSYYEFLETFANSAGEFTTRDQWFHDGAFHHNLDQAGKHEPDYLYALVKETVDLWYEMVLNLYWGGREWNVPQNPQMSPPSAQLPQTPQVADGNTLNDDKDFKFRQDAIQDLYYRIQKDIWQHGTQASDRRNVWDQTHWRGTINPADIPAILNLARTRWSNENIWFALVQDPSWADDIADALDNTVGEEGLSDPDDGEIYPYLKSNMDQTAESGNYGDWGAFYRFTADRLGSRIYVNPTSRSVVYEDTDLNQEALDAGGIDGVSRSTRNSGNLMTRMTKFVPGNLEDSGWLDRSVRGAMFYGIYDYSDLWNIEYLSPCMTGTPYHLWHGEKSSCEDNNSDIDERFEVELNNQMDGTPHLLDYTGTEIETLNIAYEDKSTRYADVQNEILADINGNNMYLCDAPFQRTWNIELRGSFPMEIRTLRRPIVYDDVHIPLDYKAEFDIDMNFDIMLFSAWPLQSGWDTDDGDFDYTREHFGFIDSGEAFASPRFISLPFGLFLKGVKGCADLALDSEYISAPLIASMTDIGAEKNVRIPEMFGYIDVQKMEQAHNDFMSGFNIVLTDFANTKSHIPPMHSGQYEFDWYGYPATIPPAQHILYVKEDGEGPSSLEKDHTYSFVSNGVHVDTKVYSSDFSFDYVIDPLLSSYNYHADYDLNPDTDAGSYDFSLYHDNTGAPNGLSYGNPVRIDDIFLEKLGRGGDLKVGFLCDGTVNNFLTQALGMMDNGTPEPETLVENLKMVLTSVYDESNIQTLATHTVFGLYFEVEDIYTGWNLITSLCLWSENGATLGTDLVKTYLGWMINNVRHLVYNIGISDISPYLLAYVDGENNDLWDNCGLFADQFRTETMMEEEGTGTLYYSNLGSNTMAVNEFGFTPVDIYSEFGSYTDYGQWYWRGKVIQT